MAVLNPSFDLPGQYTGEALHWTMRSSVAGERVAAFGSEPHRAWEDFERWAELKRDFLPGDIIRFFFDHHVEGYEDFSEGWNNDIYFTDLPVGQYLIHSFGANPFENFQYGWLIFFQDWPDVGSQVANFGLQPFEDFESNWILNQYFYWNWEDLSSVPARFNDGWQSVEDFENGWQ